MSIEDIAKIAHESYRAYCSVNKVNPEAVWEDLPAFTRTGAINGVTLALQFPDMPLPVSLSAEQRIRAELFNSVAKTLLPYRALTEQL